MGGGYIFVCLDSYIKFYQLIILNKISSLEDFEITRFDCIVYCVTYSLDGDLEVQHFILTENLNWVIFSYYASHEFPIKNFHRPTTDILHYHPLL